MKKKQYTIPIIKQNKKNPDGYLKICRGFLFVCCIAAIPRRIGVDAGPYKEKSNFFMTSGLLRLLF